MLFHDVIALTMGLISFDCAMTGALLLYLLPMGYQIPPARQWRKLQLLRAIRPARPTAPTPHPVLPASPSPAPALAEPAAEVEGTAAVAAAGHDL
jgi:hypothetical protein